MRRVCEHGDDLVELPDGARPAVGQQQRERPRSLAGDVQEVQINAGYRRGVLRKCVQARLLGAPVEAVPPVRNQVLQVVQVGPELPGRPVRRLIGPADTLQSLSHVDQERVRDVQREWLRAAHPRTYARVAYTARSKAAKASSTAGSAKGKIWVANTPVTRRVGS